MFHLTTSTVDCSLHQSQFRHVACHHHHSPKKISHNNNPQWYSSPPLVHSLTITPSDLKQTSLIHAASISLFANYRHSAQVILRSERQMTVALDRTQWHTHTHIHTHTHTPCRTHLDEGLVRRTDIYLTNTQHSQETENHAPAGFEPAAPACEWPEAYVLDRVATGIIYNLMKRSGRKWICRFFIR